jgi:hypothetical protein
MMWSLFCFCFSTSGSGPATHMICEEMEVMDGREPRISVGPCMQHSSTQTYFWGWRGRREGQRAAGATQRTFIIVPSVVFPSATLVTVRSEKGFCS